jgi:hypothetical protein
MHYDGFMAALLDIRALQIRFGASEAVRGISLQVEDGEVLGLVGESGSGKSCWEQRRRFPDRFSGEAPTPLTPLTPLSLTCCGSRKMPCGGCAGGRSP